MKRLLLAAFLLLAPSIACAQGCGQANPNCVAPTPPAGDSSNRIATTAFVQGGANAATGTIIVQRATNPSFESSTWTAFGPTGTICPANNTSSTSCLHEADNFAFPYVLGNSSPGYDLEIRGGADPAPNGTKYSGAAVLIPMAAGWTLNPMQGGKIIAHGLTFNCTITIDSIEYSEIDFEGSQVTACVVADARNALVLNPTHPSPFDLITGIGPGRISFQSLGGGMHITGAMVQNAYVHVSELDPIGLFSSGCVYQSDTATAGTNLVGNHISIERIHGINTAGMTAMCVGLAFESGGAVNGGNTYDVGISPDSGSPAVNGIDTYGHDDKWTIRTQNMGGANYIIKFESSSCRNHVDIEIQGTAPATPYVDSSGCTGVNANTVLVNGQLVTGTIDGATIGGTTPAPGSFTTLSASSTVSGTGFSTYLASPPAIGGTAPAAVSSTSLTASGQFRTTFGTPTIVSGACGTGTNGTVSGTNQSGLVSIGAAATTTCTVSFSATLSNAPNACVLFPANAAAAATGTTVARVSSVGTASWAITGSALANANYYYLCV